MWPLKNNNYKHMKVLIYIFLALAAGLLIFNLFYIDFEDINSRNAATDVKKEIEFVNFGHESIMVLDNENNHSTTD